MYYKHIESITRVEKLVRIPSPVFIVGDQIETNDFIDRVLTRFVGTQIIEVIPGRNPMLSYVATVSKLSTHVYDTNLTPPWNCRKMLEKIPGRKILVLRNVNTCSYRLIGPEANNFFNMLRSWWDRYDDKLNCGLIGSSIEDAETLSDPLVGSPFNRGNSFVLGRE